MATKIYQKIDGAGTLVELGSFETDVNISDLITRLEEIENTIGDLETVLNQINGEVIE